VLQREGTYIINNVSESMRACERYWIYEPYGKLYSLLSESLSSALKNIEKLAEAQCYCISPAYKPYKR
jgi:hypothetical protein